MRIASVALASGAMLLPVATASSAPSITGSPTASAPGARPAAACATAWGTAAEGRAPTSSRATLTNVRAGRHSCFDRLVVDVSGRLSKQPYRVEYVSAVTQDGSGAVVPLRGRAKLQVVLGAPAYDADGNATYRPRNPRELVPASSLRAVKQVAWAGSFEGQSTIGVGIDRRRAFRVQVLRSDTAPDRLVIDIANR